MKNKTDLTSKIRRKTNSKSKENSKTKLSAKKLILKNIFRTKSAKEKILSSIEKRKLKDLTHLYRNSQNSDIDIKWTLSLRSSELELNSKEEDKRRLNFNKIKPPSFFDMDVKNYIKKKNERKDSYDKIILPNLIKYRNLFKKRLSNTHGTTLNCRSLLDFELNLRKHDNENKKNKNKFIKSSILFGKQPKWDNSILTTKKDDLNLINYSMDLDKHSNISCLEEKFVNRPYQIIFKKYKYNDNRIIYRKKYIKNKNKAYNYLGGYHVGPYIDNANYKERDYNNIVASMKPKERNQSNISFNFNLRKYKKILQ